MKSLSLVVILSCLLFACVCVADPKSKFDYWSLLERPEKVCEPHVSPKAVDEANACLVRTFSHHVMKDCLLEQFPSATKDDLKNIVRFSCGQPNTSQLGEFRKCVAFSHKL